MFISLVLLVHYRPILHVGGSLITDLSTFVHD